MSLARFKLCPLVYKATNNTHAESVIKTMLSDNENFTRIKFATKTNATARVAIMIVFTDSERLGGNIGSQNRATSFAAP